tara:strand:- start:8969 stop:9415 length:447 start_codon:yes stop_codon:yes gene_type:complete
MTKTNTEISRQTSLKDLARTKTQIVKIEDCANSQAPSLLNLATNEGIEKSTAFISLELIRLNELLNLSRPMNNAQIEFVSLKLTEYPLNQLKTTDIRYVFDEILSGKHGKMYGSINPPFIIDCLSRHFDNRTSFSGEQNSSISKQFKQ